jgi:tetratricopeptide (TPR) repeat protein
MTPDLPLQGVAIYNPHLLSKDELVEQFVARRPLLERILKDLRSDARPEHRLLVGPRGMGKTTLLRRIYFAIEDDLSLSATWLPLAFPEEQYSIASLSDLYLNCVDALSDTLDRMGRREEAAALDRARDALPARDEAARAKGALGLLLRAADDVKRKLVLLVDNIEMVLDRLQKEKEQWKVRELLSTESRLLLIGASVAASNDLFEHGAAFYNFFRVHELRPLGEDEAKEVLLHLADVCKTPAVARVVREEPVRVRTIRTLAGGNPRTLVQLYTVLAQSTEGDARSDLDRLLDQCTPLYKARFEALSQQAQKIVDALAIHWHPMTSAELSGAARLDSNVVSSQLTRLMRDGVVEAVGTPSETKAAYQVAERFFNIWYLMRASRRVRQRLVWLVEFLRLFYGQGLGDHARSRIGSVVPDELRARMREAEYRLALADAVDVPHLRRALYSAAVQPLTESRRLREKIAEIVSLEEDDHDIKPIVDKHLAAVELREKVLAAKVNWEGWDATRFADLLGGSTRLSPREKRVIVDQLEKLSKSEIELLASSLEEDIARLKELCRSDSVADVICRAVREGYIESLVDLDDVQAASIALRCPEMWPLVLRVLAFDGSCAPSALLPRLEAALEELPDIPMSWVGLGDAQASLGQFSDAAISYRKAIELDPRNENSWFLLGYLLGEFLDRYSEAEEAYRKAIELAPLNENAWTCLARLLERRLDRLVEAEEAYGKAISLNPGDAFAWNSFAHMLQYKLGRLAEAEQAYRKTITLSPSSGAPWIGLGDLLQQDRARWADAEQAYRKATELIPKKGESWFRFAWHRYLAGKLDDEAESAARKALALAPAQLGYKCILATILVRRGKWDEPGLLAHSFLAEVSEEILTQHWPFIIHFFAETVRAGRTSNSLKLLDDVGITDRWLPLHAALEVMRNGRSRLLVFAPEVRAPAEQIVAELEKLSGVAAPSSKTIPRPHRKRRRRS